GRVGISWPWPPAGGGRAPGAPANGAPLCLYWTSGAGREGQYETAAVMAQIIHRLFKTPCRYRFQPGAEGKHSFGDIAGRHNVDIAEYFRVLGVWSPSH